MPLILPVHLVCNTDDEQIYENIRVNSRRPGDWLRLIDAHDGSAIICGSGPSLGDCLGDIASAVSMGGKLFALNGAAAYLARNGLMPDYQVILDPRPETAQLIGPAKEHLFASQVAPSLFDSVPEARLWHLQVENIDDLLPTYHRSYCMIGGAASVGNTATCLAFALGYRTLHLYGYDSSNRDGKGHAFDQPMNDGDPCCIVNFNGGEYISSLTMKLQAEKFQDTARALENAGCRIHVHGNGLLPDIWNTPPEELSEREKYERIWSFAGYRNHSPGEEAANDFLKIVSPSGTVIDFGCGTGRGGLAIQQSGCNVILVDFAANCRDDAAHHLPFFQLDLSEPIPLQAQYGYCTDVMEHIPTESVRDVIRNIMAAVGTAFFQICTRDDHFGAVINQVLHLTVKPHTWWREIFEELGLTVAYDDDLGDASRFVISRQENEPK